MKPTTRIPNIWRLGWMLFMQPILLHQELVALGIQPRDSGWQLWIAGGIQRHYLTRLITTGIVFLALGQVIAIALLVPKGIFQPNSWETIGSIIGFSTTIGVSFGVGIGIGVIGQISAVAGVVIGLVSGVSVVVALFAPNGITDSYVFGIAVGMASSALVGEIISVPDALVFGSATIVLMVIFNVEFGLAFAFYFFHLPIYALECLLSFLLRQNKNLTYHPILFHDLCYLPLPFVEDNILLNCEDHPDQVVQLLAACKRSPGQQEIHRRVMARLEAHTLTAVAKSGQFASVMSLQGPWLPTAESASTELLIFRDVARYIEAARHADTHHLRQKHLTGAARELGRLHFVLAQQSKERRIAFAPLQPLWQEKLDALRARADAEAASAVPNPFLTQPLSTASGVEVFVGRDDLIRTLDAILADPQQRNSLALLGPRRCGKSSLLRMLPLKLPDAVPVFFDLQDNPATTPAQFFSAIASRAAEQARRERDLVLPKLAPNPDITAFAQWLEQVDTALGSRRLLLCIDEFERLPDLFPGDHRALLQLMGLFRATVQNRRNIRLLVAGVAPFDELDAIWSDHLINLRELRVEHLDPDSALRLLTRPIPGFDAIPEPVAREVITRTGCQPLLLQLYGSMLVDRLNAEQRTEATLDDLTAVDRAVREEGNAVNHFRNIYDSAPDDARAVLLALSDPSAPSPKMSSATRRYLLRRCFITPEGVPRIPVFFDWVQAEHG